jgi:hypothetical protein
MSRPNLGAAFLLFRSSGSQPLKAHVDVRPVEAREDLVRLQVRGLSAISPVAGGRSYLRSFLAPLVRLQDGALG